MQLWTALILYCVAQTVYVNSIINRGKNAGFHCHLPSGRTSQNLHHHNALAIIRPSDFFPFLDKLRSNIAFHRQLSNVPLYIVVDDFGTPIISHYPSGSDSSMAATTPVVTPSGQTKARPDPSDIVAAFIKLFSGSKGYSGAEKSTHDIDKLERHLPNVRLYFMDPNACAAQIQELRRQGKTVRIDVVTLNDYIQQLENAKRDVDPILLPLADGLIHATNNGNEIFLGTPVFTTDPPIVKTTPENLSGDYDPSRDKLVAFLSPKQALSLYRKIWWKKNIVIETNGQKEYYKMLPQTNPWSPEIRSACLEDLCRRTLTEEPYWGLLLYLMPPDVPINNEAENVLMEHKIAQTPVRSLLHSIRSLFR
ncbi:hypothetical protein X943_002163 [Babesia divergens]|uniref:Uncharacterized protein n=1 Tax=Babesia divergens TaxID=32595 RepID=A0AAD9GKV5_BABDI|nr:hypothetical protein X943_002163 [Babesia divergens]